MIDAVWRASSSMSCLSVAVACPQLPRGERSKFFFGRDDIVGARLKQGVAFEHVGDLGAEFSPNVRVSTIAVCITSDP
jgi:hypothetical protein